MFLQENIFWYDEPLLRLSSPTEEDVQLNEV